VKLRVSALTTPGKDNPYGLKVLQFTGGNLTECAWELRDCQFGRLLNILELVIKESKEPKQNIRYLGFETTSDGGRRFDFSITARGQSSARVTLDIPGQAFTGENRISYQESAKICYEKLRVLIEGESGISDISTPSHISITREDIARFRHVPRGRARPKD
jgi:hypothetical protein